VKWKASFEIGSSISAFKRWKQARFQLGFDAVNLHRPTAACKCATAPAASAGRNTSLHEGH
jgi:hypothetical protein